MACTRRVSSYIKIITYSNLLHHRQTYQYCANLMIVTDLYVVRDVLISLYVMPKSGLGPKYIMGLESHR